MGGTNFSETFSLRMLLERESREVSTSPENPSFGKNTNTTDTINVHLHIRVTIGVPKVGKMRPPGSVFRVPLDDNCIFVKSVGKSQGSFGLLPRVKVIRLFTTEPLGEWSPYIWISNPPLATNLNW